MVNSTTYLSPGFFVTLTDKRQVIHFPLTPARQRRATPARLALIDEFNRGYSGDHTDLIKDLVQRYNGHPDGLQNFLNNLQEAGCLTDTAPAAQFTGEPSGATGVVGTDEVTIATPISLVSQAGQYLWYSHDGTLLARFSLPEVMAVSVFSKPISVKSARELYLAQENDDGLDAAQFDALMSRLAGAGLFIPPPPPDQDVKEETVLYRGVDQDEILALVDARLAAHDEKVANSGKELVQVVPVNTQKGMAPASLGLVVAYAMKFDNERLCDKYDFVPMFLTDEARLVERAATPSIFLFSNYLWSEEINLQLSAAVKAVNPASITVHGGPSTPSYEHDCEKFFADNPHVDICVRAEGEATFADLLDKLDLAHSSDLEALKDVPGLTYRTANGVCRTGNRERIADLNTIPSPYLMGLFDDFGSVGAGAVIETNRGCPYGCTFCDWGSATLSKIRRFDLDRVFKELEWSATHQIEGASIADANFGMYERDVEITEKLAELKRTYGYPRMASFNYAKNKVKYQKKIIMIMAAEGIMTEGRLSMQTMDETTLKVIDRSNIKLDKYNELADEMRSANLPMTVEFMMGLPGATVSAFRNDLQQCTDRDVRVELNPTQLLPNSPMNDPKYRKEYGIVAKPGELLQECSTYTREEWDEMNGLRSAYYLLEGYSILRYVARYVRREKGMREVEFYGQVRSEILRNPDDWPVMSRMFKGIEAYMAPPGSWGLFIEEVRRYLLTCLGMDDGSSLRTTLAVQLAHLPTPGREFPLTLELEHDFAAWWEVLLAKKKDGHRHDWQDHIPRLSEFGPARLTIQDPSGVCGRVAGTPLEVLVFSKRNWDMESPVGRPLADLVAS